MDQARKRSHLTENLNIETKKLRCESFSEKLYVSSHSLPGFPTATTNVDSSSITLLEELSSEIFYEIFDYLDGNDVFQAFSKLNGRFQQLLISPSLPLRFSFNETSLLDIEDMCHKVLIPNKEHIFSLHLSDSRLISAVFRQCGIDSSFTRLQSIYICTTFSIQLLALLSSLKSLPQLLSLHIHLQNGYSNRFSDVYRMVFDLPTLKAYGLSVPRQENLNIFVPIQANEQFSTIERLSISHICDLSELSSICRHTPRLKRLTCQSLSESNKKIKSKISITLLNLTHFSIHKCRVKFDEFEAFMQRISRRLQVLRIDDFRNRKLIYPVHWERLVCQHMPDLAIFELTCSTLSSNIHFEQEHFDQFGHQFTSQLWLEYRWNLILQDKPGRICYLISSKRSHKQQRSHHPSQQMMLHSTRQSSDTCFSSPFELSITNCSAAAWRLSFDDFLHPVLCSAPFRSLHLFWSGIPIGAFVKLLNQLPNLDSLKLSSSLLFLTDGFHANEKERLRINNKITKVWLWMEMEHVRNLIELCPLMEHFEVNGVKDVDLQSLVRSILMETQTNILHLRSLCLRSYNTNDRMVEELQILINRDHLLNNYTIKRSDNTLTLKWN